MLREFKEFALRGNVVDMAVGIVIGSSFGAIVRSLVDDVLMPPLGLVIGGVDFSNFFLVLKNGRTPGPYAVLAEAQQAGAVTVNFGVFLNVCVSFTIIAFTLFLVVKTINRLKREREEPPVLSTTRECPYCICPVSRRATRCPHCTAELQAA